MSAAETHKVLSKVQPPRKVRSTLWIFFVALIASSAIWMVGALTPLDHALLDLQTQLLARDDSSDIVIVEIDARTLKGLGQWPFPRGYHAQVLRALGNSGARSIFVDIDFSARSVADEDARLAESIKSVAAQSQVILATFWQPTSSDANSLILSEPLPELRTFAELGLVNLVPGPDGLVREVPWLDELRSGAPPVWHLLDPASKHRDGALEIDYRRAPSSFQRISYIDVLNGTAELAVRGKVVFVGATALELGDIVAVPIHRALPGVIVQALAYESARSSQLERVPTLPLLAALALWTALCTWFLARGRWHRSPLLAVGLATAETAMIAVCYGAFDLILPVSPFIVATLLVLLGSLLASLSAATVRSLWALRRTREHDALLRQVVDHSSDAILTLDEQLIVRTANRAAHEILGRSESLLVGRSLGECSPPLLDAFRSAVTDMRPEVWLERTNAPRVAVEVSAAQLTWEQDRITTLTLRDVTAQRFREAELRHLALHDALTGLPNRFALAQRLEESLATRRPDQIVALLMLDLDGFKEVNDTLGHSMGDELMRELGSRLRHLTADDRQIARLGGDEFAVQWRVEREEQIEELAQQLLLIVEEPIVIKGIPVSLGTSIGVAMAPRDADDAESLLKRADIALYVAKRKHTRVEFYDPSDDTSSPRRLEMLSHLRAAVAKGELFLEYQPKVTLATDTVVEVEALCRWQSPIFGRVSPGEFIPLAEASDLIKPLTEWTILQALADCRTWRELGIDLRVAVNLSARHLQDAHLPTWLEGALAKTNTRPDWLELEITESAIMTDPERASKILRALQGLGVLLSIDDFGTGYSSLAYLRTLAVDRLKLDRSFIASMDHGSKDQVIVESTIKLAHGLDLEVVAEGIENQAQFALLKEFGCDLGQGYWIAKPMPMNKLLEWYRQRCGDNHSSVPLVEKRTA
jgi:diguanylate cyclase (GGDEF)-like protein/PAS domain S-box-containing protein